MTVMDKKFGLTLLISQLIFLVIFVACSDYDDSASARYGPNSRDPDKNGTVPGDNMVGSLYPMFQDVHVMIFIGFGFLMTFLKKYGFSAVGLNMLLASFVVQWAMLNGGIMHSFISGHGFKVHINIANLLTADFAAAAVLITFGALLGKTSPLQLVVIAFLEIIFFLGNESLGLGFFRVADVGGSMFVHVFGAYFGLSVSRVLYKSSVKDNDNEGSNYHSDIFSMIGTIFLWLYWPSFNSALAVGDDQHRAVINTYLALASCCVMTFALSSLLDRHAKLDMVHVQNATLAGGVAVGTSADMMIQPWGAVSIGMTAGALSVCGFKYITPFLSSRLKVHDTCGVNNLHGMPGLLAGICGSVAAAVASTSTYGYSLYQTFPARAPQFNTTELHEINAVFSAIEPGDGRTAMMQAMMQMTALMVTLVIAIVGGVITGFIVKLSFFDQPRGHAQPIMDDSMWWETPGDYDVSEVKVAEELHPMKKNMNYDDE